MAISLVESVTTIQSWGGIVNLPTATTTGELIVIGVAQGLGGTLTGFAVSDNASGGSSTYTTIQSFTNGSHESGILAYAWNVASGITQLTVTFGTGSASTPSGAVVSHYTGVQTSATPLDLSQAFNAAGASPFSSTASGTLSNSGDLVIGIVCTNTATSNATFTSTGGFTSLGNCTTNAGPQVAMGYDLPGATTSLSYSGTGSTAGSIYRTAIAAFLPSAAVAPPTGIVTSEIAQGLLIFPVTQIRSY